MFRLSIKTVIILVALILVLIYFILPIKLPYTVNSRAKVLPSREWIISKTTGGQLTTTIKDNKTGVSRNYSVSEFQRGDAMQLVFRPELNLGTSVNANDTIGTILSNEIQLQLVQLNGQLEQAKANLNLNLAGEKTSIIEEAEKHLAMMK